MNVALEEEWNSLCCQINANWDILIFYDKSQDIFHMNYMETYHHQAKYIPSSRVCTTGTKWFSINNSGSWRLKLNVLVHFILAYDLR